MKKVKRSCLDPSLSAQPQFMLVQHLDACWKKYRSRQKRIKREFTKDRVHDLRVSIRNLISMIDMGRAMVHEKGLKRPTRLLKLELDAFDELRDTQVQITVVDPLQEPLPEIIPYRDYLHKREQKLVSGLKKKLRTFRTDGVAKPVARLRKALLATELPQGEASLWSMVDKAYALVLRRQAAVRADQPRSVHRMRLAFKKFRYMLENIYSLLPHPPADLRRQLHDYQALMGDVQDAVVAMQMLTDFAVKSRSGFPAAMLRFEEMQHERIQAFMQDMERVKAFWRNTPREKFPWSLSQRTLDTSRPLKT